MNKPDTVHARGHEPTPRTDGIWLECTALSGAEKAHVMRNHCRTLERELYRATSAQRKGGQQKTPAQTAARRENGKLGGRPKKKQI